MKTLKLKMKRDLILDIIKPFRRINGLVLLNISGLALGLASIIFIIFWITHETSYDRHFRNSDRIFRVESLLNFSGDPSVWTITPSPVAESIKNDFPEVEEAVRLSFGYQSVVKVDEKLFDAENLYYTDSSYFKIFSVKVIRGDETSLLTGPDEVVLSKSKAAILFGDKNPVGKTVLLNNKYLLNVKGVIEDSPSNTHLKVDYLVSFSVLENNENIDFRTWGRFDFLTYVLLKEGSDPEGFNEKISGYIQSKNKEVKARLFINPLTRLYLYRDPGFKSLVYPSSDPGPIARVYLFGVIGFVLLLIACINFVNLSTAFASRRAKEVGVRKVNGAGRRDLVIQFFGEALLQTFLATLLAIVIVIIMFSLFRNVSGLEMRLVEFFSPKYIMIYLFMAFGTGLIAGMYPAMILSSFDPVKVIKPLPDDSTQGSGLRKTLVVVQFTLSVIFIFCILVINKQIRYMQEKNLGFNNDKVMVIYPKAETEKIDMIAEEIAKIPGVKNIALGGNVPVNMGNFNTFTKWDGNITGKPLMFFMMQVDDRYLDLLDIKIVDGRKFNYGFIGKEVIINEAAAKRMEMNDPVGKGIWAGNERINIIGVVKDFHFHNLKDKIQPVFIYKDQSWWQKRIFVKLEPGNQFRVVDNIVSIVSKEAPGFPVRYIFLDQETDRYFDGERRLNTLVNVATFLSIVISCIGLFSLTAFTIRRKQKEIGIRKAFGASAISIVIMLQKDFGKLVVVASIIGLPAGWYIMKQWLNSYSYHLEISIVSYVVTILAIFAIALLTLAFHTVRAANLNPAETVRNE